MGNTAAKTGETMLAIRRPSLTHTQILLALYNGAPYLSEQLDSLVAQSHTDWRLLVSDDASVDAGPGMLRDFAAQQGDDQVRMIAGPTAGASAN